VRRPLAILFLALCPAALAACGPTASNSYKGAEHEVAQTVVNLQSDATKGDEKKICQNDLAGSLVSRLGGQVKCEAAVKAQLKDTDSFELTVESVKIDPGGTTASVRVQSLNSGKKRIATLHLTKEAGGWRISGLQ
jgi:hypothetical protein